ncbi:hypothetical protein ZOSMA_746G00010 [Zostera marina]|uniref:Uncharacterized protein n=1 Tax=Zostera marina TaxID=29655 RepID=A0A0K9NRT3_ZOSMR|nr:hypothetical protein ZOSMA_746G00010 [Zostera marina]
MVIITEIVELSDSDDELDTFSRPVQIAGMTVF